MCGLGGVFKKGDVTLKRDQVGHILPHRALLASILGVSSSFRSGLSKHTLCVIQIHHQKKKLCTLWQFNLSNHWHQARLQVLQAHK